MPRIRWARRLADGTEQQGIECVCGGDLLATDEPGVWRCQRCGSEWKQGRPVPSDAVTGERASTGNPALELWYDEQRYKRSISRPGSRSSRSRRKRRKPLALSRVPLDN